MVLSSAEHHNTALLFEPKLFFTQKRKKSVFQPNKSCFWIPLIPFDHCVYSNDSNNTTKWQHDTIQK